MQDNQHLTELPNEGTGRPNNRETEHLDGSTANPSVPTGGARPKVFSSYMRMTKSKSARFGPSYQCSDHGERNPAERNVSESHCLPLTTSTSFVSARHPFSYDTNGIGSANPLQGSDFTCDDREPMERWKNAGIALRKALSSSSSRAITTPISNCTNRPFRISNQGPLNGRSARRGSRRHLTRKSLLDTDSLAMSDASAILSNIPVTSSPLLCKKHGSSVSESPLTGDLDIASTSQFDLRRDFGASTLPPSSSFNRLKRADSFSKSENEIDVTEKRVLERSPGMFNLCSEECDFIRTFDSRIPNQGPRGLVMTTSRTLDNVASRLSNCAYGDNQDSIHSQTYKMLECRLNSLISSDDKSFLEYSSSDSDITDCSSLYEDDDIGRAELKVLAAGALRDEREPKKQKRKSQTSKKYRNGETTCSSDSVQEGVKNCQRQKKKMKGGFGETLGNSSQNNCLYVLDTPLVRQDWSHSSITDSDSETNAASFHRRSRVRSGRTSREKKVTAEDVDKISRDFRWVSPVPRRHANKTSRHTTTKGNHEWASTDSMSDSLLRGQRHLGTYSSSSSLDKVTGCDLDRTIPPLTWSIVDGLQDPDSQHRGPMSRGLLRSLRSNNQDQVIDCNRPRTWTLLDSLCSQSNENLSNMLPTSSGRHRDHQRQQDDSEPSCGVTGEDGCCSCSASKGGNSCCHSESQSSYHYKDCTSIDDFTWNKLDTQLTWDMWDLPPSESTLIDISAAVACHSESETHSGLDGDTDSADADDEFECDCIHCQQMRDVFSQRPNSQGNEPETVTTAIAASSSPLPLPTSTASILLNTGSSGSLSSDHNDWSTSLSEDNQLDINISELNPLDLLLMRQDARRDMLELMFQNVILQMLAVHPDLLNDQAPPPATQTVIENLQSIHATQEDVDQDSSCPICLCSWELNEIIAQLPCQHLFHPLCIRAWLVKSGTCPVCRHVL